MEKWYYVRTQPNPWRRDFYPHYKANRKKARDNDDMDWTLIFDTLHKVKMEIKENFPIVTCT